MKLVNVCRHSAGSFESRRGTRAAHRDSYALYGFASSTERLCEQDQVAVVAVM
jgi:hypothetical protein